MLAEMNVWQSMDVSLETLLSIVGWSGTLLFVLLLSFGSAIAGRLTTIGMLLREGNALLKQIVERLPEPPPLFVPPPPLKRAAALHAVPPKMPPVAKPVPPEQDVYKL